jgi:hypothetical protein
MRSEKTAERSSKEGAVICGMERTMQSRSQAQREIETGAHATPTETCSLSTSARQKINKQTKIYKNKNTYSFFRQNVFWHHSHILDLRTNVTDPELRFRLIRPTNNFGCTSVKRARGRKKKTLEEVSRG